jgi:site-specific recombinase XerD
MILRAIQPLAEKPVDHPWLAGSLKQLRQEDLSPMTVRGYESDLQSFLRWYESRVLEQLTIADVMNYWRHLGVCRA